MEKSFLNVPGPDIVIRRTLFTPDADHPDVYEVVQVNIPRTVIWHSPDGFDVGYNGAGPADLALNILVHFIPGNEVPCSAGTACSREAAKLHLLFRDTFLAPMSKEGGLIPIKDVQDWIAAARRDFPPIPAGQVITPRTDAPADAMPLHAAPLVSSMYEDLRKMARLVADFLHLEGHQRAGAPPAHADPIKACAILKQLDAHLALVENRLGIASGQEESLEA